MCGALSCGQYRMDRIQELVMAERLGDKCGDETDAQGVLHEATPGRSLPTSRKASSGCAPPAPIERGSGRAAQADEGLLDARALGQDLARVLGIGVVQGTRVHLQRGLGLAEPARGFKRDLQHWRRARAAGRPSRPSANAVFNLGTCPYTVAGSWSRAALKCRPRAPDGDL